MGSFIDEDVTPLWSVAFETGNAEIDRHHQCLLADSAQLKRLVESGAPWEDIKAALGTLIADCSAHFRFEEELLRSTNFSRLDAHIEQHQEIEVMLQQLADLAAEPGDAMPERGAVIATMERKIVDIIVRHDLDFKSHLLDVIGH
jgi:hemerythrin-like metal-binding protein